MSYIKEHLNVRPHGYTQTPQSEPIPGKEMTPNSAGGFSFALDKWGKLDRFLIMGSEGGTFYVNERKLTVDNCVNVVKCIKEDGIRVIDRVVEISQSGRAPKNDTALFVLALCLSPEFADVETRRYVVSVVPKVARIGTHIFQFTDFVQSIRGWGKLTRKAVASWFESKEANALAYQAVKYKNRGGWSLRDLMRQSHPRAYDIDSRAVMQFIAHPEDVDEFSLNVINVAPPAKKERVNGKWISLHDREVEKAHLPSIITGALIAKNIEKSGSLSVKKMVNTITDYNLPRECIPTEFLNEKLVWEALLEKMPITAMIRNLGKMTSVDLLQVGSEATDKVLSVIGNDERIVRGRVHPLQFLVANKTYAQGRGFKGSLSWNPVPRIVSALDAGFYKAFKSVEPSNKVFYLGIDVSSSMDWDAISPSFPLTCAEAAAAMALVTLNTEPNCHIYGFASELRKLGITPGMTINEALAKTRAMNFGSTDCAAPMMHALKNKWYNIDAFVIYTDSETWAGRSMHPAEAIVKYRDKTGTNAKLVVCGMESNDFTIADPNDPGMLDVVGFDSATPNIITSFVR